MFTKLIHADTPATASATLDDTATVTPSDATANSVSASVDVTAGVLFDLTVTKTIPDVLQGAEAVTFEFDVTGPDSFSQQVSVTFAAGETSKSVTIFDLEAGAYTVHEVPEPGWNVLNDQDVIFALPVLDPAFCFEEVTFDNDFAPASAQVQKTCNGGQGTDVFMMTLSGPTGTETVQADCDEIFVPFTTVLVEGDYTITEELPAGWVNDGSTGDCAFTVDYPGDAGALFSCSFENTKLGTIKVTKVTDPSPDPLNTTWTFTGEAAGPLKNGQTITVSNLLPGSYSSTETLDPDYDLTSIVCDDGLSTTPSTFNVGAATANFELDPGETVECTFTNVLKRGEIIIDKVTNPPGDPQLFGFTLTGGPSSLNQAFPLADTTTPHSSGPVLPGSGHVASETLPDPTPTSFWTLDSATCDDGSPVNNIDVGPGETVTCTFVNTLTLLDLPQACVVIIDEETIDNDISTIELAAASHGVTPDSLVNDDHPTEIGNPPLRWNVEFHGDVVKLPGGQVNDWGWFALPEALPFSLEDFVAGTIPQSQLDKIPDVKPLNNADIASLVGRSCVAVVYDSDISLNYKPLNANLQGARYGLFYFTVLAVEVPGTIPESQSSSSVFDLWVQVDPVGADPFVPLDVTVNPNLMPDSIQITKAKWQGNQLEVRGTSDNGADMMTVSVDGPDEGMDPNVAPFQLLVPMTEFSTGEFEFFVDTPNIKGRRVTISTDTDTLLGSDTVTIK